MIREDNRESAPVLENDFIFGSKSAQMYEEYNVLKTNRHSVRQKRILVIDGA